jgi:hypothetical protein
MTWTEKYQPKPEDILEAVLAAGVQTPQARLRREELFDLWLEGVEAEAFERGQAAADAELAESEEELAYWKDQFQRAVAKLDRTYQGYEFTGGRSPSPRERKRVQAILKERRNGSE